MCDVCGVRGVCRLCNTLAFLRGGRYPWLLERLTGLTLTYQDNHRVPHTPHPHNQPASETRQDNGPPFKAVPHHLPFTSTLPLVVLRALGDRSTSPL